MIYITIPRIIFKVSNFYFLFRNGIVFINDIFECVTKKNKLFFDFITEKMRGHVIFRLICLGTTVISQLLDISA
jgi:hypothetical protein